MDRFHLMAVYVAVAKKRASPAARAGWGYLRRRDRAVASTLEERLRVKLLTGPRVSLGPPMRDTLPGAGPRRIIAREPTRRTKARAGRGDAAPRAASFRHPASPVLAACS